VFLGLTLRFPKPQRMIWELTRQNEGCTSDMSYEHAHDPAAYNWAFGLGVALNISVVIVEAAVGYWSSSLALLSDAGHNASDVLGLLLAWGAYLLMQRPPTQRHTYGWRRSTILAAMLNAVILLVAVGGIVREAVGRFYDPEPVASTAVILVAAVGTAINSVTALLFRKGQERDLNVRGAFIHMSADAAVSAGVVVIGLAIGVTGWLWLDPMASLVIAAVIFWGTWGLLRDTFHLEMGGVPRGIDVAEVYAYLCGLPGVQEVHDLHIWALSTSEIALTAHLVKPYLWDDDALVKRATDELQARFSIDHVTLQWERSRLTRNCERVCDIDIHSPTAEGQVDG
jgi:cobalt-zinc-cadmium efflux system protein